MQIEVVISGWEQGCCGTPFKIGDHMTWKLLAMSPAGLPEGALPRFEEKHHDLTPEEVPHWDISGVVIASEGITYPLLPIIGQTNSFAWDTDNPIVSTLGSVEKPSDPRFDQYRLVFDAANGVELPPYAPEEANR